MPALTDLPHPYPFSYDIQTLLHFTLPILRVLLLVLLFFALINPVVTYTTVTSPNELLEDQPTSTSLLLSSQDGPLSGQGLHVRPPKYGTFEDALENRSPLTQDQDTGKIQVRLCTFLLCESVIHLIPAVCAQGKGGRH